MRVSMLLAAALLTGCAAPEAPAGPNKLPVVATFGVLAEFAREVGGGRVAVTSLVGPDGDPHVFEPSPADVAALGRAAVTLEVGAGFEPWFARAYEASGSRGRRCAASRGVGLRRGEASPGHASEVDPHVWHDAVNALTMVENVRHALCEADPPRCGEYQANAGRFIERLERLHAWVIAEVAAVPPARRRLVTNHDTFGYFARRYGFEVSGSVLASVSTEAADPSATEFAELVRRLRAERVPTVFCEASHNPKLAARLAEAAGVRLGPPLYTDSLGPPDSPGATYEGMMRHNVGALRAEVGRAASARGRRSTPTRSRSSRMAAAGRRRRTCSPRRWRSTG